VVVVLAGHCATPSWKASGWPHSSGPGRTAPARSARVQATRMTWWAARALISPRSTAWLMGARASAWAGGSGAARRRVCRR
jgi:hypothetical protein